MKKKLITAKTLQALIFVAIAIICLVIIFTDNELYQAIGHNPSVRNLCILLWIALVLAFIIILFDFRAIDKVFRNYSELHYNVATDPIAGIANRYSCDSIIEKYSDKPLPPEIGCVMLEISNIRLINQTYGHVIGNATIQAFSDVLSGASVGLCFVGRNGGNKFMALFEDCTEEKLSIFMNRVRQKTEAHNLQKDVPWIEYRSGRAFNEGSAATSITQLISLADRRITNRNDRVTGIPNRESCDEVIAQYQGKQIPEDLACVMFDFVNLKAINDRSGRLTGDAALRRFSDFLRDSAKDKCFVGRNGGTRFLAIMEESSQEKIQTYLDDVNACVQAYNDEKEHPSIQFSWGIAFREPEVTTIGQMLTISSERIRDHSNT